MNIVLSALLISSFFFGPLWVGAMSLLTLTAFSLQAVGVYSDARLVFLCCVFLLVPLSARICGQLLDEFLEQRGEGWHVHSLSLLASVGSLFFLLSKVGLEPAFSAVLNIPQGPTDVQIFGWIARFGASALFCAFLSALVVITIALMAELPLRFMERGSQRDLRIPSSAFRQGIVVLVVVVALDLVGGLMMQELAPLGVIASVVK